MKKQVIMLFGPPGAGKGTQGELLSNKMGLYYFETSKILEREFNNPSKKVFEIDGEKFEVLNEKKLWIGGKLCSPPFVSFLVKENIKKLAERGENLLLSGSPRTLGEAENLIPLLEELYDLENIKSVLIDIKPGTTVFRNSNRRICELMRHSILYNEETKNLTNCPLDGSMLIRRKGLDDPETIKVRLEEYKNRTLPILDFLKKRGIETKKVNGEQSPVNVYNDILDVLK